LTPPAAKNSDEEVIAYVQATPGAIGYVTSAPPASVTVLKKF
jgi:ABC-type phosphate transport system substrate-binding protein